MTTHHPTERRIPRSAHTRLLARPGAFRAPGAPGPLAPDGRGYRREDTRPASRALTPFPFQWIGFGNPGVIADNDPIEQEKAVKFNALLTNAVIFHNALDIAKIVRQLLEGGWVIDPEDLAHISPCLTEHINRFGEYSTHELGIRPDVYDPKLDVDFAPLREQNLTAAGFGQAA